MKIKPVHWIIIGAVAAVVLTVWAPS